MRGHCNACVAMPDPHFFNSTNVYGKRCHPDTAAH
jgi:hypothetical protein